MYYNINTTDQHVKVFCGCINYKWKVVIILTNSALYVCMYVSLFISSHIQ